MKKLSVLLLTAAMLLSLAACGAQKEEAAADSADSSTPAQQQDVQPADAAQQPEAAEASATDWPTETIFPAPEGCKIIQVRQESYKHYITGEWDGKEAAKAYIEAAKAAEGDGAEVIGQGETEDEIYYGTYGITVTSMNEAENIVLYK